MQRAIQRRPAAVTYVVYRVTRPVAVLGAPADEVHVAHVAKQEVVRRQRDALAEERPPRLPGARGHCTPSRHAMVPTFPKNLGADMTACLVRFMPMLQCLAVECGRGNVCCTLQAGIGKIQADSGSRGGHQRACSSHDTGALLLSIANAGSALSIARGTGSLSSTKLRTAAAGRPSSCDKSQALTRHALSHVLRSLQY